MEPERDFTLTTRKRNEFVLNVLRGRFGADRVAASGVSVLDVGCGGGDLAGALGRAGVRGVLGIDLDPRAVAAARARCGRHGHRFETLAAEDLRPVLLFDAVVLSEVLVYLRDPAAVLRAMRGWIRPGGVAVLTVANGFGPWAVYRAFVERRQRVAPGLGSALGVHRFGPARLRALVREAGFRIEAWGRSNFLSAVYPFSLSRYHPERFGFVERIDVRLADLLPRSLASGWNLSLVPGEAVPVRRSEARPAALAAWR